METRNPMFTPRKILNLKNPAALKQISK